MNLRFSKSTHCLAWHRAGGFCLLLCGLLLLIGCSTEKRQAWLTVFFDGVPPLGGVTNAPVVVAGEPHAALTTNVPPPVVPTRSKEFMHPPFAEKNCTACHESQFSNAMRGKPGEACFVCHTVMHTNFVAGKIKHPPVAEGDCKSCHDPHHSPNKKLLQKTVPELCLTCHDDPLAAGKFKHQAVESGACLDCHAAHSTNFKGLLKQSVKATCADCHDDLIGKNKFVHQPVGDGD